MKNKEEKKNRIWVPIVIGAVACSVAVGTGIALVHNQQRPKAGTVATVSDAVESVPSTTEVVEITTEEATTEAVVEVVSNEGSKPEAVPATTEIGGGKKKEETTEEQKPSTSSNGGSGHSNSGNAGSGQSTTPKPSNSGNSGSSNSGGNSGNSGSSNATPSPKPSTPATTEAPKPSTTEAPTTQHQHVYDQVVVDTPEQSVYHPAEYKTVPAMQCNGCLAVFTSLDAYMAHPCSDYYGFGDCTAKIKVQDEYTDTIPAKTHMECKCGARE